MRNRDFRKAFLLFLILLTFNSICFSQLNKYERPFAITGIKEHYTVEDSLLWHAETITKFILACWDSVQHVNRTIIIDTLNSNKYDTNNFLAYFLCETYLNSDFNREFIRYQVNLENINTGEQFVETVIDAEEGLIKRLTNHQVVKAATVFSAINFLVPMDQQLNSNVPKEDGRVIFDIRTIDFGTTSFNESQKRCIVNLINNAFIAAEKETVRYNRLDRTAGNEIEFSTRPFIPGNENNEKNADYVLDFNIKHDEKLKEIVISYDLSGEKEANLLLPSEHKTVIEVGFNRFSQGETLEINFELSKNIYSFIRRQFYFPSR